MGYTYRFTDLTRWGVGKGSRLSAQEGDDNNWYTDQRLVELETKTADLAPAITDFTISGRSMYVNFSDSTVKGPYTLPIAQYSSPGDGTWQPNFNYVAMQTFSINGGFYFVNIDHTSASTFDAGANDGNGHDYYALMFQTPEASLPTGGAPGQILYRTTLGVDFAVSWRWIFPSPSGKVGKFLRAKSGTQDDVEFADVDASVVTFTPSTGSGLVSDNAEDAINELAVREGSASTTTYTPSTGSGLTDTNVEDALNTVGERSKLGRHTIYVPAAEMTPSTSAAPTPGIVETATNKNILHTLNFNMSTAQFAMFDIAMPKSWDRGSIKFALYWSCGSGVSGDVVWKCEAYAFSPGFSLDEISGISVSLTSTASTANYLYTTGESDIYNVFDAHTGVPPSDDAMTTFRVTRDASNSDDTLSGDARLHGLHIFYDVDKSTDD